MIIRPSNAHADWFTWWDPPPEWLQPFAENPLPGLVFGTSGGRITVEFHYTHLPCMPEAVRVCAENWKRGGPPPFPTTLLRTYQREVACRLGGFRGALLAMEMRTGKTPTACHMHDPAWGPLVILGPLSAREAWREWVDRTFNWPLSCLSTTSAADDIPSLPAYFCHYEIAGNHATFLTQQGVGTLVLDEVHYLQSKYSRRVQAVALLAAPAKKILGLSGTPIWNKPKSLWQLLHLITPGAWGSAWDFKKRYCQAMPGAYGWTFEGATNEQELKDRLALMTARLTWKDVAPELPPTTRVFEPVSLTAAQYADLEASAMKTVLARGNPSAAGYFATLRRKAGALKVKPAVEAAKQAMADGHKVVLWAWHNEIIDKLDEALDHAHVEHQVLRSAYSPDVRDHRVSTFRACPEPMALVAAMGVGKESYDLSCADHAIFVELDWTPPVVYQAEMRTFHKDRPHSVTYFYTDDPVESKLIAALDAKNGFANALGLGSDAIMREVLK